MVLIIDWGNTLAKAAVFNVVTEAISEQHAWPVDEAAYHIGVLMGSITPKALILSAVMDIPQELTDALSSQPNYIKLDSNTRLPVMNAYHSPATSAPTGWRLWWLQIICSPRKTTL